MKYLIGCSVFIGNLEDCQPMYIDLAIYVLSALALMIIYVCIKKGKKLLTS